MQGSVLKPTFFAIFIESFLRQLDQLMPGLSFVFADDIKFVAEASEQGFGLAQRAVNVIGDCSITHLMPLSVDKSLVLYIVDKATLNFRTSFVISLCPLQCKFGRSKITGETVCRASNTFVSELSSSIGYYSSCFSISRFVTALSSVSHIC